MASQSEKERRRQERLEAERKAERSQKRLRIVQFAVAGILVLAIGAGAVIAIVGNAEGGDSDDGPSESTEVADLPAIPARRERDLQAAVQAAGCELGEFESEGQEHIPDEQNAEYDTNPPTSGPHHIMPAQDGVYDPGNAPAPEEWLHTLEHGRIILQYKPGTPERVRGQLERLFNEPNQGREAYHMALMENTTEMDFQVAAVGWQNYVGCDEVTPQTWDALRAFRDEFTDQAPERVP